MVMIFGRYSGRKEAGCKKTVETSRYSQELIDLEFNSPRGRTNSVWTQY